MQITEVRVRLVDGGRQEKLKAFCSITIDDSFVVRDLKIIDGTRGLFVAMPSRKLSARCSRCGCKNQVGSNFCSECGNSMPEDRRGGGGGHGKLHADIAHPINSACRQDIQARVLEGFRVETEAAARPDYTPCAEVEPYEESGAASLGLAAVPVASDSAAEAAPVAEVTATGTRDSSESGGPDKEGDRQRDGRRRRPRGKRPGRRRPRKGSQDPKEPAAAKESKPVPVAKPPAQKSSKSVKRSDVPPDDNFDDNFAVGIF